EQAQDRRGHEDGDQRHGISGEALPDDRIQDENPAVALMPTSPIDRRTLHTAASVVPALPSSSSSEVVAEAGTPFKIDCQSHLFAPELIDLMSRRKSDPTVFIRDGVRYLKMGDWLRKIPPLYLDVDAKLATMDAAGIAMTALSINDPGPEWFGGEGPAGGGRANDFVADVVRRHPARFFGLCVLPLQNMSAA